VFMPDSPVTRGKIPLLENDEEKYSGEVLKEEALRDMETINVDTL
ncbi:MAG: tRNA 4-thiouridine(8) synthase ThiI, partial [Nitrospina sp.]|nr:tRNA 4-thiouridine(8) synthase ThiI [Nitrospina sp.]